MKNLISKILGVAMYVAADLGLGYGLFRALGAIYQRYELSEDFVENHPWLSCVRIVLRALILFTLIGFICVAPAWWVICKILDFCDEHFSDDEEKKEWD